MKFTNRNVKNEKKLPLKKQVHIILETQEEIDQLFAMLNCIPIAEAIETEDNDWNGLKEILPHSNNCIHWHKRLSDRTYM
jgi:hypothetical protein